MTSTEGKQNTRTNTNLESGTVQTLWTQFVDRFAALESCRNVTDICYLRSYGRTRRLLYFFERSGITTMGDVVTAGPHRIRDYPGIGSTTIRVFLEAALSLPNQSNPDQEQRSVGPTESDDETPGIVEEFSDALVQCSLSDCSLSVRATNILKSRLHCSTVGDALVKLSHCENLLAIRGVGQVTASELRSLVEATDLGEDAIREALGLPPGPANPKTVQLGRKPRPKRAEPVSPPQTADPVSRLPRALLACDLSHCRLSTRAKNALSKQRGCSTVEDALRVVAKRPFFERMPTVGRKTAKELRDLAMTLGQGEEAVRRFVTGGARRASFVAFVDNLMESEDRRNRDLILSRWLDGQTLEEVGTQFGLSRERVRQIERRFLRPICAAPSLCGMDIEAILEDDYIAMSELAEPEDVESYPPVFYQRLARVSFGFGPGYPAVQALYREHVKLVSDLLKTDTDYVLGNMTHESFTGIIFDLAPCLREMGAEAAINAVATRLNCRIVGDRVLPERFSFTNSLRALVKRSRGEVAISTVARQLGAVGARFGEFVDTDAARLRSRVRAMADLRITGVDSISAIPLDEGTASEWSDRFVAFAEAAQRPASVIRFLERHAECPFDREGLSEVLRSDDRISHVGRYLYSTDPDARNTALHVRNLVRVALESDRRPWTTPELLTFIRERRQLISPQIESSFESIAGLVRVGQWAVALQPLDESGKRCLIRNQHFLRRRLRELDTRSAVSISGLWPDALGSPPELSKAEMDELQEQSLTWAQVEVERDGTLFFRRRRK